MRRKSPAKEAAILAAATELFVRAGVSKTTMGEIAKRAGIAVGTLYIYFENKEAIIVRVADTFAQAHAAHADHVLRGDDPPAAKLRHYVAARLEAWTAFGSATEGAAEIARTVLRRRPERITDFRRVFTETISGIIAEGNATGAFAVPDPTAAAEVFVYGLAAFFPLPGAIVQHPSTPDALARVIDWFLGVWSESG